MHWPSSGVSRFGVCQGGLEPIPRSREEEAVLDRYSGLTTAHSRRGSSDAHARRMGARDCALLPNGSASAFGLTDQRCRSLLRMSYCGLTVRSSAGHQTHRCTLRSLGPARAPAPKVACCRRALGTGRLRALPRHGCPSSHARRPWATAVGCVSLQALLTDGCLSKFALTPRASVASNRHFRAPLCEGCRLTTASRVRQTSTIHWRHRGQLCDGCLSTLVAHPTAPAAEDWNPRTLPADGWLSTPAFHPKVMCPCEARTLHPRPHTQPADHGSSTPPHPCSPPTSHVPSPLAVAEALGLSHPCGALQAGKRCSCMAMIPQRRVPRGARSRLRKTPRRSSLLSRPPRPGPCLYCQGHP
mmetsp:Transcript_63552/g.184342  ORF Transcript_63552/g.184342 Transcript_63552/m.184342 type:complete len:357 (-) Transcript_63552:924-1994(-)